MKPVLTCPALLREQAYIDGRWLTTPAHFEVRCPASGTCLGRVSDCSPDDVLKAIAAADKALPAWRARSAKERASLLRRWFELIVAHADDLARLMSAEQGKPFAEARGEVLYGASFIEWFAEEGKRAYGDVIPSPLSHTRILTLKAPIGVVGAITPWNFPSAMVTRKAGPALAAGCTFILKPASETPLSALALAELAERAGLPAGVFNVVPGARAAELGAVLTGDARVRKFSFTGSTAVGKTLIKQCAETVKKVTMELGGNAPFIVFNDADLDAAVTGAIASKFRNAGQTCVCANRFLVEDSIYEAFASRLASAAAALHVGAGYEAGAQLGPLINQAALDKVQRLVGGALAQGARAVTGAKPHARGGTFYLPTVLADVTPSMAIFREEIFGPVAPLTRFSSEAEAIALANDSEYGLAAYFYGRDIGRIWRVAEALDYGIIGINEGIISNEVAPFGGMKQSGLGREGSRYGLDDYLEKKYLCLGGLDS